MIYLRFVFLNFLVTRFLWIRHLYLLLFLFIIICPGKYVRSLCAFIRSYESDFVLVFHYSHGSSRSRNTGRTSKRNDIVYSRWTTGCWYVYLQSAGSIQHCACTSMAGTRSLRDVNAPRKLAVFYCATSQ